MPLDIRFIPSDDQLADGFTKSLSTAKMKGFRVNLNLVCGSAPRSICDGTITAMRGSNLLIGPKDCIYDELRTTPNCNLRLRTQRHYLGVCMWWYNTTMQR